MPDFRYDAAAGSFKGWLMQLSRWQIQNQLRQRRRDEALLARDLSPEARTLAVEKFPDPAGFHLDAVWDEEWQKNIMEVAIERVKERVNPKQYQIFDVYAIKRWPMSKVISTFGIKREKVYLAKHRISALIKKEIERLEAKTL